jgi:hypothetical protein
MYYTISRADGAVVSPKRFRSVRRALWHARGFARADGGTFTVSEFPGARQTGRPVMCIRFDLETDWRGTPLDFWKDGTPIL